MIDRQLNENQREKVRSEISSRLENKFQELIEVKFRDHTDEQYKGTITNVIVKQHSDRVGTEYYDDIGILSVKKLEDKKWELHLKPSGVRRVIRNE